MDARGLRERRKKYWTKGANQAFLERGAPTYTPVNHRSHGQLARPKLLSLSSLASAFGFRSPVALIFRIKPRFAIRQILLSTA